jgi:hypothetical protein
MTNVPTTSPTVSRYFILLLLLASRHLNPCHGILYEDKRVEEYHRRNYTWPPLESEFLPATPGWRRLFQRRLKQVDRLPLQDNSYDAYNAYINAISGGIVTPNYTEFGWAFTRGPTDLWETLNNGLADALPTAKEEDYEGCIDTSLRPLFIDLEKKVKVQVLNALQPILEAWSGVELVPSMAYGLRVYRNTSKLYMHVDRTDTHVISAIFHVNHNDGSQPWPLVIEDFVGNTNEVMMEAGDLLLYESSKCLHGRPRRFNGEWYTSIFVHYYPRDMEDRKLDVHYRVPPHWGESVEIEEPVDSFEMIDTYCREPQCHDEWCALQESVVIRGPGPEYGKALTANGIVRQLDVPKEGPSDTSPDQDIEL